jgi:hypothetical protein
MLLSHRSGPVLTRKCFAVLSRAICRCHDNKPFTPSAHSREEAIFFGFILSSSLLIEVVTLGLASLL